MSDSLRLIVENSVDCENVQKNGQEFLSSKGSRPGLGLQSVKATVQRYGGIWDITVEGSVFKVSLVIPFCKE